MKVVQETIDSTSWDAGALASLKDLNPDIAFVFGSPDFFGADLGKKLMAEMPNAKLLGCSSAGEISDDGVSDKTLVVSGLKFENETNTKTSVAVNTPEDDGYLAGKAIGGDLKGDQLKTIIVLGQGTDINGSRLIEGIIEVAGGDVVVTGGLAGDDAKFEKTYTLSNEEVTSDKIVALGIYGESLNVGYGSMGGWEPFGPSRRVTKADNNVLIELDGERALDVYKKYLGDEAKNLPGAGLLYPFAVLDKDEDTTGLIRTILAVDEETGSLTLAGDIQEGGLVRLMHTELEGLVSGAQGAAEKTAAMVPDKSKEGFGLLVSCIGRKLVMGNDTEEEVDTVKEVFGDATKVTGFYSYGEICPFKGLVDSKLHNQTMTITHITEK